MAVSRRESFFLRLMIFGSIAFQPEALDTDYSPEEDTASVKRRFRELPSEKKKAFKAYFRNKPFMLNRFPIQIYKLTGREGHDLSDYRVHFQYDLPDRKTEAMRLVLAGFDMDLLKGDYFSFAQLHELRRAYERGTNIAGLINNGFSRFQLKVLAPAIRRGYDVSHIMDPSIPARDMFEEYYQKVEDHILYAQETETTQRKLDGVTFMEEMLEAPSREDMRRSLNHQINHAQMKCAAKQVDKMHPSNVTRFPDKAAARKTGSKGDLDR